jgi:hypothetical protein
MNHEKNSVSELELDGPWSVGSKRDQMKEYELASV